MRPESINLWLILFLILSLGCHNNITGKQDQHVGFDRSPNSPMTSEKIWSPSATRLRVAVNDRTSCDHDNPIDLRSEDLSDEALRFLNSIKAQTAEPKKCYKFPSIKITVFKDGSEKSYESHMCPNPMIEFEVAQKLNRLVSFKYMGSGYSSDHVNNIYHNNIRVENVDFNTFEIISRRGDTAQYAKDRRHVYRGGNVLEGRDVKTFEVYGFWYTRDKNNIYYDDEIMDGVDKNSFEYIENHYAQDSHSIFFAGKVMEGVNMKDFQVVCDDSNLVATSVFLDPASLLCSSVYNEDTVCEAVNVNGHIEF